MQHAQTEGCHQLAHLQHEHGRKTALKPCFKLARLLCGETMLPAASEYRLQDRPCCVLALSLQKTWMQLKLAMAMVAGVTQRTDQIMSLCRRSMQHSHNSTGCQSHLAPWSQATAVLVGMQTLRLP